MIRRSTVRLPVAVLITATAAMIAIMWGRADAAILAAPWTVLLAMGLSGARRQLVAGSVTAETGRVLTGDEVSIITRVSGANGWVQATCRPEAGFWLDGAEDSGEDLEPVADVARPDRPTELRSTLTASAWGAHDIGRVDLQVHEPYGLLRWSGSLHTPNQVRVHPRPIDLQQLLAPWFVRRLTGAHGSRTVGRGVEYADVRPFTTGDSLRDINWRASARSDEIWVSQRHPDRSTDVILLLDTFTESGHDIRAILGLAIEAAVALAESHLAVTDRVGLIELGGIVRWVSPGTGQHQLHRLTDALLATRLYDNAADRHLLVVPSRALPPRSFIVAMSPLLDDRFVDSLAVLRAGGHDVSVIEVPPILEQVPGEQITVGSKRGDHSHPYQLAFRLWQAERGITRDRLAELGITVGLWEPDEHFDLVLAELTRRRRGVRAGGRP